MLDYVNWGAVFSGAIALIALIMSTMLALNLRFGLWRDWSVRYSALLFICLILYSGAMLLEQTPTVFPVPPPGSSWKLAVSAITFSPGCWPTPLRDSCWPSRTPTRGKARSFSC